MMARSTYLAAVRIVLGCVRLQAEPQAVETEQTTPAGQVMPKSPPDTTTKPAKRGEIAIAPIPVIDPTVGNGVAVAVLYAMRLNREDQVSPPSVFAAAGVRTSNGTWLFGGGAQLYLKQDRFRILVGGATGRVNYKYYGQGNESTADSIPITQTGTGILTGLLIRTFRRWYVGPRYQYFTVTTGLDDFEGEAPKPIQDVKFKLPVASLGVRVQRDTRASQFYPRSGSVFDTRVDFSSKSVGAKFTYQPYQMAFQQYLSLGKRQVLAYRIKACGVNGNPPFFALCSLGDPADMRGYPMGRYRDRRMLVGQAEFRQELWWRFGAVAFLGAGQVGNTFGAFDVSATKPGGGVG